jgi:peptidoglycan/xylan/chitin deacetylase (PgdA/CDA1 family)
MRAVLTYHSIDESGSPISVRRDVFERHVKWLTSGRVRVVPLGELMRLSPDTDAVALTFDDAFANFASCAAPLLSAHALPATVLVVTGDVGRTTGWWGRAEVGIPTLPLMDWATLERLAAAGISPGSHTRTHRNLTDLGSAAIDDEVAASAECLYRRLGVRPSAFAYPYGRVSRLAARRVAALFSWGCTTDHRPFNIEEQPSVLPRLDMYYYQAPGRLEAWGTIAFRCHLASIRQRRRLRSMLVAAAESGRT